jgi:hypothetical protein
VNRYLFGFVGALYFSFESICALADPEYTFKVHQTHIPEGRLIDFVYTNTSLEAHCIRNEDMELKLTGDSLYVSKKDNEPVKFIGRNLTYDPTVPYVFIVLPPGAEVRGNIYLDKYYGSKSQEVYVSYKMPVVFCKRLLKGYIEIPPTDVLKDKLNNRRESNGSIENVLEKRYPEWTQNGFIAESETLLVD